AGKPPRQFFVRKQIQKLVTEHGKAARFENDDRGIGLELRPKRVEDVAQHAPRLPEKSVVVERTPAAQRSGRKNHVTTGAIEHFGRGHRRFRMEMIVKRVRPEKDPQPPWTFAVLRRSARSALARKRAPGKHGN